jgi:transcriptional regulator with XRE-family HTH domain
LRQVAGRIGVEPSYLSKIERGLEPRPSQETTRALALYLGEDPDTQEALEFLCLAEGGEVTHYEVLASIAKDVKYKKFGTKVRAILQEEKRHLDLCTKLAKSNAASE